MKYGYKIFRLQTVLEENGKVLKILKYLGQNYTRRIWAVNDSWFELPEDSNKKEIIVKGIDKTAVG